MDYTRQVIAMEINVTHHRFQSNVRFMIFSSTVILKVSLTRLSFPRTAVVWIKSKSPWALRISYTRSPNIQGIDIPLGRSSEPLSRSLLKTGPERYPQQIVQCVYTVAGATLAKQTDLCLCSSLKIATNSDGLYTYESGSRVRLGEEPGSD
jgi:hypothetical protein